MKATTCLQYCINGMGKPLFNFTDTNNGKQLIDVLKKLLPNRDDQIRETLIAFNSYFMAEAAMKLKRIPMSNKTLINFMATNEFDKLHKEIVSTIKNNYPILISSLSKKDKRKLDALFE